jgi:hypothetical protein
MASGLIQGKIWVQNSNSEIGNQTPGESGSPNRYTGDRRRHDRPAIAAGPLAHVRFRRRR